MKFDRSGELPTQRSEDEEELISDAFVFTVVEGPDAGASFTLEPAAAGRILVGKSVTASFRLADPEVSRRHASLRVEGKGVVLNDLTSTNGTRVNNVAIREALLSGGEALRLGKSVIMVGRGSPSAMAVSEETGFGRLLGVSRAMRQLYPALARFASTEEPLLIEGETGTGKELCAEEIHARSPRREQPFTVVDAQALAPDVVEKQLSEATTEGGTVFVREVSAIPYGLQRFLAKSNSNARLLFGTKRDLDRDVERGTFREELLVRLAPRRIELPPLRDRAGDVDFLSRVFWQDLAAGDPEAKPLPVDFSARFHRYKWPGNVRELALAVAARWNQGELGAWEPAALAGGEHDLVGGILERELPLSDARQLVVDELERRYVQHMLTRHGNTRDAARAANVGLRYFQILRARFQS